MRRFSGQSKRSVEHECHWAGIVTAHREMYPGLLQSIALKALHRGGREHRREDCELCQQEAKQQQEKGVCLNAGSRDV